MSHNDEFRTRLGSAFSSQRGGSADYGMIWSSLFLVVVVLVLWCVSSTMYQHKSCLRLSWQMSAQLARCCVKCLDFELDLNVTHWKKWFGENIGIKLSVLNQIAESMKYKVSECIHRPHLCTENWFKIVKRFACFFFKFNWNVWGWQFDITSAVKLTNSLTLTSVTHDFDC